MNGTFKQSANYHIHFSIEIIFMVIPAIKIIILELEALGQASGCQPCIDLTDSFIGHR